MDVTSQEKGKQQRTGRIVLTSLPQPPEASIGLSSKCPRCAMSRVRTLGDTCSHMQCLATGSVDALKKTGLTTMDMTSQEKGKQQQTRRNVLTSLHQTPEASTGLSRKIPRCAMSRVQNLGDTRRVMQCLATGSVDALKKTGSTTMNMTSQEKGKQQLTRR